MLHLLVLVALLASAERGSCARSGSIGNSGTGPGSGIGSSPVDEPVFSTFLYSPTTSGGLQLVSNYTLLANAAFTSLGTAPVPPGMPGRRLTLTRGDIENSNYITNAGCIRGRLNTSSAGVAAFLTTAANYDAMYNGDIYNLFGGIVEGGLNLSSAHPGPVTAVTGPAEVYTLFVYSLDRRPSPAAYFLSAYPPGAAECAGVAQKPSQPLLGGPSAAFAAPPGAGASLAPAGVQAPNPYGLFTLPNGRRLQQTTGKYAIAPASAAPPPGSLVQTAQIRKIVSLQAQNVFGLTAITNASCIAYRSRGQPPTLVRRGGIDLTVLVLNRANLLAWGAQAFSPSARGVATGAECLQNASAPGACGRYLDGLNASDTYFIIAASGLQNPRQSAGQALLELYFTAQASGSCAANAVQIDKSEAYYGQGAGASGPSSYGYGSYYDYSHYSDYGSPAGAPYQYDYGYGPSAAPFSGGGSLGSSPFGSGSSPPSRSSGSSSGIGSGSGGSSGPVGLGGGRGNKTAASPTAVTGIFPIPTLPVG